MTMISWRVISEIKLLRFSIRFVIRFNSIQLESASASASASLEAAPSIRFVDPTNAEPWNLHKTLLLHIGPPHCGWQGAGRGRVDSVSGPDNVFASDSDSGTGLGLGSGLGLGLGSVQFLARADLDYTSLHYTGSCAV